MTVERTNLFAYTEPSAPSGAFVGYVSINRETDGQITLTVRERGDSTKQATIALSPETLEHLATEVMAQISGEARAEPVAWANFRHDPPSYVPFRTREEAQRSVDRSEIAATQEGPYSVAPLYA